MIDDTNVRAADVPTPAVLLGGFSLYRRGIVLVVVPALIQIGLLALLFHSSRASDAAAYDDAAARTYTAQARDLIAAEVFILTSAQLAFTENTPLDPEARKRLDKLEALVGIIERGGALLPEGDKSRQALPAITGQILVDIESQKLSKFIKQDSRHPMLASSKAIISDLRTGSMRIVKALEQVASRDERLLITESPQAQEMRRRLFWMAFAGTILNLVFMLAGAVAFNRDLVRRLLLLQENTRLIAAGEALRPPMSGSDEIAQADGAIHRLARALEESARREEILFNSVKTVLVSLDRHGRINGINNTIREVLGFSPAMLIGKHLTDFVAEDYKKQAGRQLEIVCAGSEAAFQLPIVKKDGSLADTTWSVKYVAEEENLFCVVQDDTEYRKSERVRKQVVQMVSHDLRSPLSTVRLVLQMLETGHFIDLSGEGRDRLAIAGARVASMLTLVNNLLDIEKIEAGMLELEKEDVPVHVLSRGAVDQFTETIRSRRIEIFEAGINISVYGDKFRLIQILTNLLSFALRRSPDGGQIRIAAASDRGLVVISVADQGPILPPAEISGMFARYRETAGGRGRDHGKSSQDLDLVVCRSLIDLHGGKIWATSEAGKGTSLLFSVPH